VIGRILRNRSARTEQRTTSGATNRAPEAGNVTTFLDPATLARIGNLELLAKTVVEGFVNGLHRSPHLGMSTDFAEHRPYMPGDDIRRIDWRLFARTDRFYLKEFEADTSTNFSVLLDVSASMGYGSGSVTKLDYARYLAACLAYFSHGQRDRVGIVTFDSDVVEVVPPATRHLTAVLHTIERAKAEREGAFEATLKKIAEQFRRRSMLLVISDFYEDPSAIINALRHLRQHGNDIMVVHVLDPAELEFPFDTAAPFEDVETGKRMPIVPKYLREQYRERVRSHIETLRTSIGAERMDYAMFDTSKPLDYALFDFLSKRHRLLHVR
jgi:uncharacterized protein (DUF58 family)